MTAKDDIEKKFKKNIITKNNLLTYKYKEKANTSFLCLLLFYNFIVNNSSFINSSFVILQVLIKA